VHARQYYASDVHRDHPVDTRKDAVGFLTTRLADMSLILDRTECFRIGYPVRASQSLCCAGTLLIMLAHRACPLAPRFVVPFSLYCGVGDVDYALSRQQALSLLSNRFATKGLCKTPKPVHLFSLL
jgi:hypothetical protein